MDAQLVDAWSHYFRGIADSWQDTVTGLEPKVSGCGDVYEIGNPLNRPNENAAIADMRELICAEPHYHRNGEVETYFVLQGSGRVVVGTEQHEVKKGDVVITPSGVAHFTVPEAGLVVGVVNTPPFNADNYVVVEETDPNVQFDADLVQQLVHEATHQR